MTIDEVLDQLDNYNDEMAIYVGGGANCNLLSDAIVANEGDDGATPVVAVGLEYLMDVELAKTVVEVWRKWRHRDPSKVERLQAVMYYARNDAFLPV